MLELGHKERHLLSGIGVQVALVMAMVFFYTQAIRQVNLQRERVIRLQEQLTVAREELAKQAAARVGPSRVEEELAEVKASWTTPEGILEQTAQVEELIRHGHGLSDFHVKAGKEPSDQREISLDGGQPLEFQLYPLEMTGFGTTRAIGEVLAHLADPGSKPARILMELELKSAGEGRPEPVRFTARYVIPAMAGAPAGPFSPTASDHPELVEGPEPVEGEPPKAAWGPREEPFLSPLVVPSALRQSAEKLKDLRLSGMLREGESASCVINGEILKPGDRLREYQVVLITDEAVLLQGPEEELLLRLP